MYIVKNLSVKASTAETLATLKDNLNRHIEILKEAKQGYREQAKKALLDKLGEIKSSKIVPLEFSLRPPQDYTKVYQTAIKMLEIHKEPNIELDGQQVRNLIMDEWDWMEHFLTSNRRFSQVAAEYATVKGL